MVGEAVGRNRKEGGSGMDGGEVGSEGRVEEGKWCE